ncbi:MAG TPA: hypothetical protein VJ456_07935, partial [Acidimicrobiia bacterium]|nr:hypothetical protein [Acidimicrobiia bacterium]
ENGTAAEALTRRSSRPAPGAVVVVGGPQTIRANQGKHLATLPGALGDALHAAGVRTAAVGNADGGDRASRPAAAAVMDDAGSVDAGAVEDQELLVDDPFRPFGERADPAKVLAQTEAALGQAQVVVVDPGDIDRALQFGGQASTATAAAVRRRALTDTDALLGRVAAALPARTLLLVVSVVPPAKPWHLTPVVASGAGVVRGYLHSPSTKRLGLVTLTDVAPTILDSLGAKVPAAMIGDPLRYHPGTVDVGRLAGLDADGRFRSGIYFPIALLLVALHGAVYLLGIALLSRRRLGRSETVLRYGVLLIAGIPLATFLLRTLPIRGPGAVGFLVIVAIDVAAVALAGRARRHPLSPLAWLLGATAALLVFDLATGGRLQVNSVLGYTPTTAARFFGIGNTAFAVLAATALLATAIHVQYAPRRREALLFVLALLVVVVVVDGTPTLGDDVGGILTLVPVFGLSFIALSGRRLSWRTVAVLVAATVVVLGAATLVDVLRPPEARTHLGRMVTGVRSQGGESFVTTVARKTATNLRVFQQTVWSWLVPIIAIFLLYLLLWEHRLARLLPRGSPLRIGVVGALAAGLLGFAVNDSGVIITALVYLYLGPYLMLLAIDGERPAPQLLEPSTAARSEASALLP